MRNCALHARSHCALTFSRSSLTVYALRMLFFTLALLIAARPDLDNPGCYRNGWDYFRGACEGISLIFFVAKIIDEMLEMLRCVTALFMHLYTLACLASDYLQWFLCKSLMTHKHRKFVFLQLQDELLQGLLQLHAAACSFPALPDHPF